jgi:hypothetical protein
VRRLDGVGGERDRIVEEVGAAERFPFGRTAMDADDVGPGPHRFRDVGANGANIFALRATAMPLM